MTISKNCIELIKSFEGLRLKAYKDAVGVWTIGYGNTRYNGRKVKQGDIITQQNANDLLQDTADEFTYKVGTLVSASINQNQVDALTSFVYNVGTGNFSKSTLLKKVNANPCDLNIAIEFAKWNKAGGKVLAGLTRRRQAEADLYFKVSK